MSSVVEYLREVIELEKGAADGERIGIESVAQLICDNDDLYDLTRHDEEACEECIRQMETLDDKYHETKYDLWTIVHFSKVSDEIKGRAAIEHLRSTHKRESEIKQALSLWECTWKLERSIRSRVRKQAFQERLAPTWAQSYLK